MEIRHLKYFLMVAEELNFSKAAEKLFISQPPLSRQIKELEEEIGARLFERNNKKVTLTEAGKYFKTEAQNILKNLERASIKTKKIANNISGEYRIAYISSTFSEIISSLLKHLSLEFPYVNFKLYEIGTVKQISALELGKLDLGILRAPIVSDQIKTSLWFKDGYSLVFNKLQYNLKSDKDIMKVADATFVFFNKDYAPHYHDSLIQICSNYGFSPNVVHESNNINSIIQLVQNGLGVSIVPSSLEQNNTLSKVGFIHLNKTNLFTEVMLASPKDEGSPITKQAVNFLNNT